MRWFDPPNQAVSNVAYHLDATPLDLSQPLPRHSSLVLAELVERVLPAWSAGAPHDTRLEQYLATLRGWALGDSSLARSLVPYPRHTSRRWLRFGDRIISGEAALWIRAGRIVRVAP